jgi:hypothetical protein
VHKLRVGLLVASLACAIQFSSTPVYAAVENCQSVGNEYRSALYSFQTSQGQSNIKFKELVNLKKDADRLYEACIKAINNDFKIALRAINLKYESPSGSREEKLTFKTKKNSEIAAATLLRDKRIRELTSIPELPQKPIKGKVKNRKS